MKVYLLQQDHREYDCIYHTDENCRPYIFSSKDKAVKWIEENWNPRFGGLGDGWVMRVVEVELL